MPDLITLIPVDGLATGLMVPDLWQQRAVNLLRSEHDVIVDAPTGAGKTLIFELLVERAFPGRVVFTVPTRALANDKLREWQELGWNVGIATGDLSYNLEAPVVVATLETQKRALLAGQGPRLLVIDEYQMLGDAVRGVNYELALAVAPAQTQLLLLSGSVGNPQEVEKWLCRCGRRAVCVRHNERPVPLDEIHLNALPDTLPKTVRGRWPRLIGRALAAGLGPILIFAPRRRMAESLARTLAAALPEPDALVLSPEQQTVAGAELTRCLKNRVAFHHSGMGYVQRAGLVEPLAKNNQLKIIVATTGLAAGINFSMRSVLVLEREYRVAERQRQLRPDELLQMFGRAGRRGLDTRGTVLYIEGRPRLGEARPLRLRRENCLDWPSLIALMAHAGADRRSPLEAVRELTGRLFSREPIHLGLEDFLARRVSSPKAPSALPQEQVLAGGRVWEIENSEGVWERRRAPVLFRLKDTLYYQGGSWRAGLSHPKIVASLRIGSICKLFDGGERRYGLEAPIATFPKESGENRLLLSKWLLKALREQARSEGKKPNLSKLWSLEKIERELIPKMPKLTRGGRSVGLSERGNTLQVRLDYSEAEIHAYKDLHGCGLLNPPQRQRVIAGAVVNEPISGTSQAGVRASRSVAEQWYGLGLIDEAGRPTRRGVIFSFFNHGEGLAIAAGLEAVHYPVEELVYDLANIRAGHRFHALALAGRPLTAICQAAYGADTVPGYLRRGLPEDYGEGASEIIYAIEQNAGALGSYCTEDLSRGDIERANIEWHSLCTQVASAPEYDWERWRALQAACRAVLQTSPKRSPLENFPPLTRSQKRVV